MSTCSESRSPCPICAGLRSTPTTRLTSRYPQEHGARCCTTQYSSSWVYVYLRSEKIAAARNARKTFLRSRTDMLHFFTPAMTGVRVRKHNIVYLVRSPHREEKRWLSNHTSGGNFVCSLIYVLHTHNTSCVKLTSGEAPSLRRARQASIWPFMLEMCNAEAPSLLLWRKTRGEPSILSAWHWKVGENCLFVTSHFLPSRLLSTEQQCLRQTRCDNYVVGYNSTYAVSCTAGFLFDPPTVAKYPSAQNTRKHGRKRDSQHLVQTSNVPLSRNGLQAVLKSQT